MSSRIDTLEPNGEPLAVLLASIVARISAQDFAQASVSPEGDACDIARHAQRAIAGTPLGVARSSHPPNLIATVRLFVAARIRASASPRQHGRQAFAGLVSLLRNLGASHAAAKIGAGLAVAMLGLVLVLVYASGRFARSPLLEDGPAPQTQARSAAQLAEERPLRDGGIDFTRANVRYCTFQQIRLEALGPITEGADLVVFNALVEDWNGRCTKHRYRAEDKEAVDAEAGRRRALLEVEGRALMNVWRRKVVTTVRQRPAPTSLDAPEPPAPATPAAAVTPEQPSDAGERLPLLITLGRAAADDPDRDIGPSLRTLSLALLRTDVATRVQRRLNDLGYTIAVDGTWGTASRTALRRFKKANGLLGNDAFDAETVTRLFSTTAVAAGAGQQDEETATIETVYPPPPAADMNPLNRADGQRIQQRLAELGYYNGRGDGAWDAAARVALRKFRAANGLGNSEDWDAPAETVLFDEQAVRATDAPASDPRGAVAPPPVAAAVPLPPKRPAPQPKVAEHAAAMASGNAPRPPALIPVPARAPGAGMRTSP